MRDAVKGLDSEDRTKRPRHSRILVAGPGASFAALAAETIATEISRAIKARRGCALMLSGGKTPRPVYEVLGNEGSAWGVDWSKVSFYYADERCVPPNHPESNYLMTMESLLGRIAISPSQIERMRAEDPDLPRAAGEYDRKLPERLDIIQIGRAHV